MNISYDAEHRLWANTDKSGECWIWKGNTDKDGYGSIRISSRKAMRVHRLSFFLSTKIDPAGKLVCHHCDNPGCVNPAHLYLGTALENNRDKVTRGRCNWAKGEKVFNAKFTKEQIKDIFRQYRQGGVLQADIAKYYGVTQGAIHLILSGKCWGHLDIEPIKNMRSAPKVSNRALTPEQEEQLRIERNNGVMIKDLSIKYGIWRQTVRKIINR
jgi:transposase-like protein